MVALTIDPSPALPLSESSADALPGVVEREIVDWRHEVESRLDSAASGTDPTAITAGTRREHVIVQIRLMNPGATREMLDIFTDSALNAYLDHLKLAAAPRGPLSRWLRPTATPSVTRYRPDGD